ncbi:uncharacterized protein TRUGW13939_11065 [Talaromyces rugulosus]|uniref:Cytochrome P450 n=1 Tax=Talaromyces rugulosus TaxID=121627 RepID=A0A7H8RH37_TALRU|nr:uncharacterized protein TRUGW13939_11065 [Talaromyces rugulosus]QKX63893.1 hypothetical protein TRUGW13939_11065 [Talaromyces rugulosus]
MDPFRASLAVVLGLVTLSSILKIFIQGLVSPLRVLPGPFLAKFSNFWLLWAEAKGCRTETIHSWHEKYGPISSVFMKGAVYDTSGRKGIFVMRDKYEHRERRRILNHAFTQSNLFDLEPLMKDHIQKLCHKIGGRQKTDVLISFRLLALDIVGELFLGKPFGALDQDYPPAYAHDLDNAFLVYGFQCAFPVLTKLYGEDALHEYKNRIHSHGHKDLLHKLIESTQDHNPNGPANMTNQQVSDEVSNLIFAGTDTTSTTLT